GFAGGPAAVKGLRERVEAPGETREVKAAALQSLGRIGDESTRPLLLAAVNDPDAKAREAALWGLALGKLQSPADRSVYLRQFAADRAFDLLSRCEAIQALADIKDTGATDILIKLLENEPAAYMPLPGPSGTQQEIMVIRYQQARDVRAWTARTLGILEARQA